MRYNLVDGKYGNWQKALSLAHGYIYSGVYGDDIALALYRGEEIGFLQMSFDDVDRCWYVESDEDIVGIVAQRQNTEINIIINLDSARILKDHVLVDGRLGEAFIRALNTALDKVREN